jgi:FkbM family methyltransferase
MNAPTYRAAILRELARDRFLNLNDNFDHTIGKDEPPAGPAMWKQCIGRAAEELHKGQTLREKIRGLSPLGRGLAFYLTPKLYFGRHEASQIRRGEFLYDLLDDAHSKSLLIKLIAYRILGHRKVKLPRNTPKYWSDITWVNTFSTNAELLSIASMGLSLAVKDMSAMGYDMRCYAGDGGLACVLVQKQYEYHRGDVHCKAEAGDVVIDAGACWGETSIYFAHEVGPTGQVLSYEFIPSNLAVARRNLDMNPHLKDRVQLVEMPLWSTSGVTLGYIDRGPGSQVTDDPIHFHSCDGMVQTTTIDDTIAALGLSKIDFIKMDIEGAELDSLRGAEAAIRRHRPKLAISLYHQPDDIETIPRYLAGLDLGYRFYLDHHTIYNNETVLFAVPVQA